MAIRERQTPKDRRVTFASDCRRFSDNVHRTDEMMDVAFCTKSAVWTRVVRATADYLHDTDQGTA
jgi:hypothetical protein